MAKRTTDIQLPNEQGISDLRSWRSDRNSEAASRMSGRPLHGGSGDSAWEVDKDRYTTRTMEHRIGPDTTPSKKRAKNRKRSRGKSR